MNDRFFNISTPHHKESSKTVNLNFHLSVEILKNLFDKKQGNKLKTIENWSKQWVGL